MPPRRHSIGHEAPKAESDPEPPSSPQTTSGGSRRPTPTTNVYGLAYPKYTPSPPRPGSPSAMTEASSPTPTPVNTPPRSLVIGYVVTPATFAPEPHQIPLPASPADSPLPSAIMVPGPLDDPIHTISFESATEHIQSDPEPQPPAVTTPPPSSPLIATTATPVESPTPPATLAPVSPKLDSSPVEDETSVDTAQLEQPQSHRISPPPGFGYEGATTPAPSPLQANITQQDTSPALSSTTTVIGSPVITATATPAASDIVEPPMGQAHMEAIAVPITRSGTETLAPPPTPPGSALPSAMRLPPPSFEGHEHLWDYDHLAIVFNFPRKAMKSKAKQSGRPRYDIVKPKTLDKIDGLDWNGGADNRARCVSILEMCVTIDEVYFGGPCTDAHKDDEFRLLKSALANVTAVRFNDIIRPTFTYPSWTVVIGFFNAPRSSTACLQSQDNDPETSRDLLPFPLPATVRSLNFVVTHADRPTAKYNMKNHTIKASKLVECVGLEKVTLFLNVCEVFRKYTDKSHTAYGGEGEIGPLTPFIQACAYTLPDIPLTIYGLHKWKPKWLFPAGTFPGGGNLDAWANLRTYIALSIYFVVRKERGDTRTFEELRIAIKGLQSPYLAKLVSAVSLADADKMELLTGDPMLHSPSVPLLSKEAVEVP